MRHSLSHLLRRLSFTLCLLLSFGVAFAADSDPDGERYASSADPVADVELALARAVENDRRTLVVLGANWCHDSRALAARLGRQPLADVIEENYELVFVDVGYLDKGGVVLDLFGVPQFYATPTVLIIDPASRQLINDKDRHIWGGAYNISMRSSVDYFEKWANSELEATQNSEQFESLFAEIDRFEQQQADRVAAGYAVVGPLLKAYKDGEPADAFNASWDELRDFRTAIPGDVNALRDEAEQRVAEGEQQVELEFPEYPPLSWETN